RGLQPDRAAGAIDDGLILDLLAGLRVSQHRPEVVDGVVLAVGAADHPLVLGALEDELAADGLVLGDADGGRLGDRAGDLTGRRATAGLGEDVGVDAGRGGWLLIAHRSPSCT